MRQSFSQNLDELDSGVALFTNYQDQAYALLFDELVSQENILVKSMVQDLQNVPAVSGTTILPNGEVTLVLDPRKVVCTYISEAA